MDPLEQEVKAIMLKMASEGASPEEIRETVELYKSKRQTEAQTDSNEEEVPTGPTVDTDGVNVDTYVDETFWEVNKVDADGNKKLDRDSYFDEQGNFIQFQDQMRSDADYWLGYEKVLKEMETKNAITKDAVMVEDTSSEGFIQKALEGENENISNAAQAKYDTYVQKEADYNSVTDEERLSEAQLKKEYREYAGKHSIKDTGTRAKSYKQWAKGKGVTRLPSEIDSAYDLSKNDYFNQKLTIAKRRWLKETGYDLDSPEGKKLLKKLEEVTLADIEGDEIKAVGEGEQSLAIIFNSISNDDAEFKEAVLDTEKRVERNTILRSKTSEMADTLDKSGTFSGQLPGTQTINALFGKSGEQVTIEDFALKDLETIESEAKDKSIEASLIHEQYNRVYDKLTETAADLKEIGDPKVKIEAIKAKHDLTTDKGIKAANEEITGFIDRYSDLVNDHNNGSDALNDISLAVTQIKQEMGDLAVREQDLGVFTDQIGKNHRVATQMALAFANNTVDLAQGAADVVYMVNPLGALADELIDHAGEDSYLGTVVETARILAAPLTGGASMYSGERRDDVKDAIDGYQEHVSSLVAEPPRYDDIQGVGDAVEWALVAGATQAPQLAILAATGGTAGLVMMGAMSAGQKFSAMEDQRELFEKTGGLYGQDHNFATMYAASLASGAIESLSEKVTLGLMKGTGGLTTKYLFDETGKKLASNFFRRNILSGDALKYSAKKLIDIGEEGGSEALATIGGNYIDRLAGDKTVNILSGVNESFVTGALIGSTLSMPTVFRDAHSSFKSAEASDVMEINYARIQEQNAILNKAEVGSPEYIAADNLIQELVAENASVIALDLKRVDSLDDAEKKKLVEIEVENRKIQQQLGEIAQPDMSEAEIRDLPAYQALNEAYQKNLNAKNSIISQYPADQVLRDHEQEMQRLKDQSDAIEAEGGAKINTTRTKSKTNEGVKIEFDAWKKEAQKKGNVRIAASEDGTQVYGAMVPVLNEAGKVTSYEMFFNDKNIYEDGKTTTASHELLHAAVFNTIRANPVLRRRFGVAVENILDGPGVKINEEARKDLERVKQYGKTARGEEIFAIVSENMVKGNITIDGGAIGKMKDLMRRTSMATSDTDIEFNDEQDIRDFLKDYSRSRTKGINDKRITSLFVTGAKGKLVETPATREEARKIVEERYIEQAKEDFQETLMASMRAQPDMRQEIDEIVKNPDGTPKFQTKQDFNRRGGVEAAWMKISQSPLLDGLIQQGMTELGLPPQAMKDFTRSVKEGLVDRLIKQYDPAKNDSLFGWLTGVSGGAGRSQIYRAKGDVMNTYKDENRLSTVSLDAPMGETTSFEATIEAETDTFMQQLEEMDMTRSREAREARKPKKVVNELNIDSKGKSNIKQAVVDANLSLEGVQYKDVKKLTTGKDAPLSSVLDIIAEKFGVDPKRIIKPSDLNGKQRKAAQSFINKNAAFLLEMLPEGETVSGEATGVANTKLGELYEKGERLKFKDGATAAGKFSQQKKSDLTVEQFKELFGIKPDGTFDNNRKHDGAIKALVNQATVLAANQALRENAMQNGTSSEAVIAKLGEGKAEVMFSIKVREKVKNTFDQLYPDLIKAVANSNTGDIDSIRVAVEAVYGETLNKSEINRLVNEVYDQADEYNTISQDLKSAGTVAPLSLEQFLQDKYNSANTEKGILKALQDKLPKDKETNKTISIGAHFLTDTKINQQRAIPGLISAEMKKQLDENGNRVYSDKQIAEMLIAHVAPMYAGASKIADGRFIVVDGVMIKDPEWDVRKDGSPGNKWRRWNKSDVKKASDKLFANRRKLLTKAQIAALGPVPGKTIRGRWEGSEKEYKSYQAKLSTARLKARLALEPKVGDLKLDSKGNKIPKKNRKQCCQGMPDFINILNTIGLGNIQKVGRGYTLDGVALDTTLIPETSEARLRLAKDPNSKVFENGKKQAEDARVVVKLMLDTLYAKLNSKDNYANFAMTLTSLGSSMQAPMRRAAMFEYFMEGVEDIVANKGKASIGSITEFEHLKPQEETIGEIIHSYLTTGELDMRIFEGGGPYRPYKTGVLGKDMDNAQTDAGHKFTSPSMTRGDSRQYSLEAIRDTRIRPLRSIDPAKIGTNKEFVGREWVAMNDALAEGKNLQNDKILQGVWGNISFSKRDTSLKPAKPKGISVLDFDDTLATTKSNVLYTLPGGAEGTLNAEEFAKQGGDLLAQGAEFDFSEFNKVVDGKTAPLFNKAMKLSGKFGTDNMFILTARSPESAEAIKQFLDAQGLNIPLENITGLGKSEASAKANWIAGKIGEGYNDFYFADDAIQNVDAVKAMLDQHDVKGKVQQARVEFSRRAPQEMDNIINEGAADLDSDLNIILEETKGVSRIKRFSPAKAKKRGKNKGKFKFFIPPSADDFAGLMYAFMGKGETGNKHHQWFKENLFDPFSKGIRNLNTVKQTVANDLKRLRKAMPEVTKKLNDKIGNTEYTHGDAIRVYNWNRAGLDVPGLTETDKADLIREIEADPQLKAFADGVNSIGNTPGGLTQPSEHWLGGTIASDMTDAFKNARSTFLKQWKDNVDVIFNEANMNKIEAVYGSNFREALEDILYRMENGGNRSRGGGRLLNNFTSWIHGSIGTTMFFNARSAVLQMISNVNFINWSDNNMMQAAAAFANQPQYWKDVAMIFNSPFLKQRRAGLKTDVNAAELLADIKDSKNKMKAATAYLLQLGFTPTQIADSLAIATGGATMYRNRVKTYTKEGLSKSEAEAKAFEDMMEIAEETQQSAREDRISQQQASPLGKFILAFQNTPMQYNRLIKKAAMDLVNGRGDAKANVSKIVYYGAVQNMIFYGLQQALFAALFGDDEEDELTDKKKERVINGMTDTLLRGSGIAGAAVSTIKNVIMKFAKENEKMEDGVFFTDPDWGNVVIEALNISPPIGIKARKIYSGLKTWEYNNDVIKHMSKTDLDNPIYDAVFSGTEAVTNLPLSRLYNKYQNISEAMNSDHETWKRVAMLLGWSKWSFGIKNQDVMTAKNEVKEIKAEEREERAAQRKIEREAERAEEEAVIEQGFIEDQKQEREDGKEDIICAAVNKSGKRCGKKVEGGGTYCTIHEEVEQRADNKKVQCSYVKASGDRCKMKTTNKSGKCYYHD